MNLPYPDQNKSLKKAISIELGFTFRLEKQSLAQQGFTFIELLVVVAIIGILTTIAIGSYNSFNRSQAVKIAALNLKSDLRAAKTDSIAGRKFASCRSPLADLVNNDTNGPGADGRDDYALVGYYVTFDNATPTQYTINSRCRSAVTGVSGNIVNTSQTKKFPEGVTLSASSAIEAKTASGGPCVLWTSSLSTVSLEFLTINALANITNPPISGNVGFYNIALSAATTFPPPVANIINDPGGANCAKMKLILTRAGTNVSYAVYVENNGNILEAKQ